MSELNHNLLYIIRSKSGDEQFTVERSDIAEECRKDGYIVRQVDKYSDDAYEALKAEGEV